MKDDQGRSPSAQAMPRTNEQELTVAVIGAGPLGRWLALCAARSGLRVMLEDVMPSTLHHAREYIRQERNEEAMRRPGGEVAFVSSIEDAVREADLVIDCVPDELESKLEILLLMDRMAPPRTVFATPTTRMSIEDLASCTYRAEKCVAIAVEPRVLAELEGSQGAVIALRTGRQTSLETVDLVAGFWQRLGFAATVVRE